MQPRKLRVGILALGASVSTLTIGHPQLAHADSEPAHRASSRLRWQPCGEAYPGADCAVASVPLDYDEPRAERTGIQLARIRGSHATGTLFINPGGPGGSGVDFVLNGFGAYLAELLQGRFDIVGFDPRGVGSSEPLSCFGGSEEAYVDYFAEVPWFPYQPEQERQYFDAWSAYPEHCGGQRILAHMGTADVARDLDQLREWVGDERLHYLGFSYGSFLGNTYANLFPDKVGALVIDGVVDPALYSTGLHAFATSEALPDELDEIFRLCDAAGNDCPLSGTGEAGARYAVVEAALLEEPLQLSDDQLYSYDILIGDVLSSLYAPEYDWPGPTGIGAFIDALYDVVLDEPGATERATAIREAIAERWAPGPTFAERDNGDAAFYGNICSDSEFPRLFDEHVNLGIVTGRESPLGAFWWWGGAPCARWPLTKDRYAGPWTAQTAAPVLVVGNYFDGVTNYAGAVASAGLLPNSRLLSYAGWGHTAFGFNDCVTEHVLGYLLEGTLPPEGTLCEANRNPFLPLPPEPELAAAGSGSQLRAHQPWVAAASRARRASRSLHR
ncbi:MAG: hypothetical protein RL033_300 [Pseudomonadota bacterium]|jgi:pimeloyl-ACP methyl ester carboxylesterase